VDDNITIVADEDMKRALAVLTRDQPRDVFASREDAAVRLLEIAGGDPD